ncbi:hypothetical protein CRG98_003604 [Punica granatum]|uniref:Uncharacterized protein n=1 Tax=Punica granatum TaxID=22663 RepID=A0A2I0L5S9_PUNGR|nr:hypothetical protein CRG98_003604 [Punica granatum]
MAGTHLCAIWGPRSSMGATSSKETPSPEEALPIPILATRPKGCHATSLYWLGTDSDESLHRNTVPGMGAISNGGTD